MLKVLQEFIHNIPLFVSMDFKSLLLFVLHMIDMALIGNLVLMILFAGYENFVSKIGAARESEDKPAWMGKVDFSGLKLKISSIYCCNIWDQLIRGVYGFSKLFRQRLKMASSYSLNFYNIWSLIGCYGLYSCKYKKQILSVFFIHLVSNNTCYFNFIICL